MPHIDRMITAFRYYKACRIIRESSDRRSALALHFALQRPHFLSEDWINTCEDVIDTVNAGGKLDVQANVPRHSKPMTRRHVIERCYLHAWIPRAWQQFLHEGQWLVSVSVSR